MLPQYEKMALEDDGEIKTSMNYYFFKIQIIP